MRLGFVGTGEITSAIVTGLSSPDAGRYSIQLSPRNLKIATDLAGRFPGVSVASSNQDVLNTSETVVIAVRPAAAQSVLSDLRFRSDHCVISLVSGLSLRLVSELVEPASRVIRAVPLPSTAKRMGPTAIYPTDRIAADLFAAIGTVFPVETEAEFAAMCTATATIASFYAFVEGIASWLRTNSVPDEKARNYVARMFFGLTSAAVDAPDRSFQSLARSHATAGGINEQFLRHMSDGGLLENISAGLDAVNQGIK
jgi:pyrroline-5-carboxylate reductase